MSLDEKKVEVQDDSLTSSGSIKKIGEEFGIEEVEEDEEIEVDSSFIKDKLEQLKHEQNFGVALLTGTLAMLVGSVIWAIVTALTKYQIGWMSIGVAFLVGFSIRYFGKAMDSHYGIMGAVLALIGCALGNFLTMVIMATKETGVSFFVILEGLTFEIIITAMKESFQGMDVLFYGLAIYYGYRYSFWEPEYMELKELVMEDQNKI